MSSGPIVRRCQNDTRPVVPVGQGPTRVWRTCMEANVVTTDPTCPMCHEPMALPEPVRLTAADLKGPAKAYPPRQCACGTTFTPNSGNQAWCNPCGRARDQASVRRAREKARRGETSSNKGRPVTDASREILAAILRLRETGMAVPQIALHVGLSKQAVYERLNGPRDRRKTG